MNKNLYLVSTDQPAHTGCDHGSDVTVHHSWLRVRHGVTGNEKYLRKKPLTCELEWHKRVQLTFSITTAALIIWGWVWGQRRSKMRVLLTCGGEYRSWWRRADRAAWLQCRHTPLDAGSPRGTVGRTALSSDPAEWNIRTSRSISSAQQPWPGWEGLLKAKCEDVQRTIIWPNELQHHSNRCRLDVSSSLTLPPAQWF